MNTKGFKQMLIGEKMPTRTTQNTRNAMSETWRAGRKFARDVQN